ncbi:MAG: CDP-alcohol phosphatidyltransferase family protein [Streptosporangiales bacterium]|nr:CDP-alcohol phosphatidyltransferase family protein [Streptosporangiales bacterium]
MTISVLFATTESDGRASATLGLHQGTVLARLRVQLASFGVSRQIVIARPEHAETLRASGEVEVVECKGVADDLRALARVARSADEELVIAHGDLAAHREALAVLLADPRATTGALVTKREYYRALRVLPRVRVERGYVVSASSGYHTVTRPNATFLGLLRVAPEYQETLATAAEELASPVDNDAQEAPDMPAVLLVGLVRSGVQVTPRYLRGMHCLRATDPGSAQAADEELLGVDEGRVLLDAAVKGSDGFFTTHFVSPYSKFIARWAARRGFTPNAVTVFSMGLGVAAAACFATGVRAGLIGGALLLQVAFTFDCVDGQLARYTRKFSLLGAWLDSVFDRAKEYVVYAGLAVGAVVSGLGDIWTLALAALVLQSLRHLIDFSYGARRRQVVAAALTQRPLADPDDGFGDSVGDRVADKLGNGLGDDNEPGDGPGEGLDNDNGPGDYAAVPAGPTPEAAPRPPSLRRRIRRRVTAVAKESNRIPALYWFKRMIVLPIGERFALISVTAAFYNARVTFLALLVWGGVAACYVLMGRVLRSVTR